MESKVYRNLENRLKIGGIDSLDLFLALFMSGVMNLIFGRSVLGFWMVFVLPVLALGILHFAKRNKPEKLLKHFFKWILLPVFLSAGRGRKQRTRGIYGNSFR